MPECPPANPAIPANEPRETRWFDRVRWAARRARAVPRLRLGQWEALWRAWWLMLRVRWQFRRRSFRDARDWLEAQLADAPRNSLHRFTPRQTIWAIDRAAWLLPGKCTCLHRALAGRILLARLGFPTELRIGGRHDDQGKFEAHAWLEHEGHVILGALPDLDGYMRFEGGLIEPNWPKRHRSKQQSQ